MTVEFYCCLIIKADLLGALLSIHSLIQMSWYLCFHISYNCRHEKQNEVGSSNFSLEIIVLSSPSSFWLNFHNHHSLVGGEELFVTFKFRLICRAPLVTCPLDDPPWLLCTWNPECWMKHLFNCKGCKYLLIVAMVGL